jgi:DNA polymerase III subunit gamma/tau
MSLALYRKYRPKSLEDLVGQESTADILRNAARENRFGHAYLFYGSRGTGKTSTARLMAKLLNCERRAEDPKFLAKGEPCNDCRSCEAIDTNNSLDVIEIDAASNRGIDEIRNLKEGIRSAPTAHRYKVYIIDEVHMLTGPAFNALLKTLEEPPAHAVFILATTEYEKLPATITSRTQRFIFKKLSKSQILKKLNGIVNTEKIDIEPSALELVAAAGDGSLRDAESILDQVSTSKGTVTLDLVEQLTGRVGLRKTRELTEYIVDGKLEEAIAYVASLTEEGHNLVQFTRDLIHYFRKALAIRTSPQTESILRSELTADEMTQLLAVSSRMVPDRGVAVLKSLIRAYADMRYSPFASIPLELALVEQLTRDRK